jgi:hypothetical protein
LARTAKWAQKPIDAELLTSLAEKLEKIARGFLSEPLERDIPLMVKAIRYLNHVHEMRPMDDDAMWFSMLPRSRPAPRRRSPLYFRHAGPGMKAGKSHNLLRLFNGDPLVVFKADCRSGLDLARNSFDSIRRMPVKFSTGQDEIKGARRRLFRSLG